MIITLMLVFMIGISAGFAVAATLVMRDLKKLRDSIANAQNKGRAAQGDTP
jgi:MFS superfamily sulfate permease-like transporter